MGKAAYAHQTHFINVLYTYNTGFNCTELQLNQLFETQAIA